MELSPSLTVHDLVLIVALQFQIYGHDDGNDDAGDEQIDDLGLAVVEDEEEDLHEVDEEHLHVSEWSKSNKSMSLLNFFVD